MNTEVRKDRTQIEVVKALSDFPYFVLRNEETLRAQGYNTYIKEIQQIKSYYIDYEQGAVFIPEGSGGDYVPSDLRFKLTKTLIDKEARFMFSQKPSIIINPRNIESEEETKQAEQYQILVDAVLENCNFARLLLQSAKDCFIGKRVAGVVDNTEDGKILVHFYSPLQFYYETEFGSDKITKFISFEQVSESKNTSDKRYLVNKYEDIGNNIIMMSSVLYDGMGNVLEVLIPDGQIALDYIPVVVIFNDGTLESKRGVSEVENLVDYESYFSKLGNADIDSEGKAMNPTRYTVDMDRNSTSDLSLAPGSYWDLHTDANKDDKHPSVGMLSPTLGHTESVKVTMNRIKQAMYNEVDMPDISEETLSGTITSGKALNALYFPLDVRCDEKMTVWKPSIKFIVNAIIDFALLNVDKVRAYYTLTDLSLNAQYDIEIKENYALLDDELEEKTNDQTEVELKLRSRMSYFKKHRPELKTESQRNDELMQIAIENNMLDSMSVNQELQTELDRRGIDAQVNQGLDDVKTKSILEGVMDV